MNLGHNLLGIKIFQKYTLNFHHLVIFELNLKKCIKQYKINLKFLKFTAFRIKIVWGLQVYVL